MLMSRTTNEIGLIIQHYVKLTHISGVFVRSLALVMFS